MSQVNRQRVVPRIKAAMSPAAFEAYLIATGLPVDPMDWSDNDLRTCCQRLGIQVAEGAEEDFQAPDQEDRDDADPTGEQQLKGSGRTKDGKLQGKQADGKGGSSKAQGGKGTGQGGKGGTGEQGKADGQPEPGSKEEKLQKLVQKIAEQAFDEDRVREIATEVATELDQELSKAVDDRITGLEEQLIEKARAADKAQQIKVQIDERPQVEITDEYVHPKFQMALEVLAAGKHVLMIGPAGCGKTHMSRQLAKALGQRYGGLSLTSGVSESALTGRMFPLSIAPGHLFISTQFIDFFENGGLFLLDELDAADPNVLLVINQAAANGYLPIPNRVEKPYAERHKDFYLVGAANTFGNGADRMYVGRNRLDESTLDRFRIGQITMDYDKEVEARLCPDKTLREKLWEIRKKAADSQPRAIVSTRFLEDAYILHTGKKWSLTRIINQLTASWTPDMRTRVGLPAKPADA
jgi:energy-coupling factor transporter ATP-binding protein EcfA2